MHIGGLIHVFRYQDENGMDYLYQNQDGEYFTTLYERISDIVTKRIMLRDAFKNPEELDDN